MIDSIQRVCPHSQTSFILSITNLALNEENLTSSEFQLSCFGNSAHNKIKQNLYNTIALFVAQLNYWEEGTAIFLEFLFLFFFFYHWCKLNRSSVNTKSEYCTPADLYCMKIKGYFSFMKCHQFSVILSSSTEVTVIALQLEVLHLWVMPLNLFQKALDVCINVRCL